jgi:2-dehydropantoate 2-reductase
VLLTSKAYDARWFAGFIRPYLAGDGLLVAVQNCMTAEMIGEIVGVERTVGCVVELSSQLFEPAEVRRNTGRERTWFAVGAFDAAHEDRVAEVAELLRHAGRVDISDDIVSAKWMKLVVNAMTMGLKAITGTTNEQMFKLNGPDYARAAREICLRSGEEALAAGQSLGYRVVPVFGLKPEDVANTNSLLETLLEKIVHDVGPTAINTVLQDHMKGRYSEVDLINGLVSEECRRRGRPTPVSDAVVAITRRIHAGELKPDPANLELVRRQLAR